MTKSTPSHQKSTHLLSIVLYIIAGLSMLVTIITLLYALSIRHNMEASMMILVTAFGPIANAIIGMLAGGIQTGLLFLTGIILLVSVLLYVAGRLVARSSFLADRVAALESRVSEMELRSGR